MHVIRGNLQCFADWYRSHGCKSGFGEYRPIYLQWRGAQMTKNGSIAWFLFCLSITASVFASPAMAQLQDPTQATLHINDLEKDVFKPGNAKGANEAMAKFCADVGEKLRGAERPQWEPVAQKCGQAKKRMGEYNPGTH
jgi:hypothetical protein